VVAQHGFRVVIRLQGQPEARRGAKRTRHAQGSVRSDAALSGAYFADAHGRYANLFGQPVLADTHRKQKFFSQHFAGVNVWKLVHKTLSVIVANFNTIHASLVPDKTHAPLIVNPDAVLSNPIAYQRFQPVIRRNAKIIQSLRRINHPELSAGNGLDLVRQFLGELTKPYRFCLRIVERSNHANNNNGKRYYYQAVLQLAE
jgi:hypothetical protein